MSNPFAVNNNRLQNPFYCLNCNHSYKELPDDIKSNDLNLYSRYLGFCHQECFNSLSESLQKEHLEYAYTNGDKIKRQHKWFIKNIPKYH